MRQFCGNKRIDPGKLVVVSGNYAQETQKEKSRTGTKNFIEWRRKFVVLYILI